MRFKKKNEMIKNTTTNLGENELVHSLNRFNKSAAPGKSAKELQI